MAVVRRSDASLTWNSVKGKKSCHTAVDRTAGWNIPMGLLFNQTGSCKFGKELQRCGGWATLEGRPPWRVGILCCGTLGKGGEGICRLIVACRPLPA